MNLIYAEMMAATLVTATITISTLVAFNKGFKEGLKIGQSINKLVATKEEIDEKKLKEIKRRQEGLENIMNYDYDKAIERRVK